MKWTIWIALLALFTGCNLEPRLRRPCVETPCVWRLDSNLSSTWANARWWEQLGDPILNALVVEALACNNDLKVASARVCEFMARYQVVSSQRWPQIALQGVALEEKIPQRTSFAPPGFDPITSFYEYEFTLSYELDFWGKIRSQAHAAFEEALATVEDRRTVVLTQVGAVAEAYITLRDLDRELESRKRRSLSERILTPRDLTF